MYDAFGNRIVVGQRAEVLTHGDIPHFVGEVKEINEIEGFVSVEYDDTCTYDCDPNNIEVELS